MTLRDKVLIFGDGRLGGYAASYFRNAVLIDRATCDITDRSRVQRVVETHQPSFAVNAAGVASPSLCESDPELAWRVNVFGARNIAAVCRPLGVHSVQISSNWAAIPANEYGATKRSSESVGADLNVRTSFYDVDYWVIASLSQGKPISLVETDEFNPISILGFVMVLEKMLEARTTGLVNVGVVERLSHFDFGILLARSLGFSTDLIRPISEVRTPYTYPYLAYVDPHRLSQVHVEADIREFRDTLSWGPGEVESDLEVSDLLREPRPDTRVR